ncbi:hypothetical protein [Piscinibacter koreensis]|uniref:hypothetical protein n=1 Tax=Piscinibacter koreensis TaxID=2742824 RepID=UPI0015918081|nr:hypothetical protein [Schlegelella koreensis]
MLVQAGDLQRFPSGTSVRFAKPAIALFRIGWIGARLSLGAILGFLVALYFVGAMQPSAATFARLIGLSIIAGYAAPRLWVAQEEILVQSVLTRVRSEMGVEALSDSTANPPSPAAK